MTKLLVFIFGMTFSLLALASNTQSFQCATYEQCEKNATFVKFVGKSKKLGMITTDFTGFLKNYTVSFNFTEKYLNKGVFSFSPSSLDTDSSSRDEKMHNKCFEVSKYPQLTISFNKPIIIDGKNQVYPATMNIRGKDKQINVNLKVLSEGDKLMIEGHSVVGFKHLEIPDPSIMIASVKDAINISFKINLKLNVK